MTVIGHAVAAGTVATFQAKALPRWRMRLEIPGWNEAMQQLVAQPGKWAKVHTADGYVRTAISAGKLVVPNGVWQFALSDANFSGRRELPGEAARDAAGIYGRFITDRTRAAQRADVVLLSLRRDDRVATFIKYEWGEATRGGIQSVEHRELWMLADRLERGEVQVVKS